MKRCFIEWPVGLTTAIWATILSCLLLESNAEAASAPTGLLCNLLAHPEETVITTSMPEFGWIYNPSFLNDAQTSYHIILAGSESLASQGVGDVWDSGFINSPNSINVSYDGKKLRENTDYYWLVQTVDASGKTSPFSTIQRFRTDSKLDGAISTGGPDSSGTSAAGLFFNASTNIWANRYPLRFVAAAPVLVTNTAPGRWFVDFGQDAFGYVAIHLSGVHQEGKVQARFGEMANGFKVNTRPPALSTVRYTNIDLVLPKGNVVYSVRPPLFPAFNSERTIDPPQYYGAVTPFRYFELTNFLGQLTPSDITQERLLDEFDTNAASFESSSSALNEIWKLCHNSMQILTFDGIYTDGDRERRPYEADAYIHQLSSYAVDREFTLPRYTFEYLLQNPTWPTEWKFHMIFIVWADYIQTGNPDLLCRYYDILKPDLLDQGVTSEGLIKGFPNFPQKTNSDVVDWPPADRDGFIIKKGQYLNWTNSINNAFYYHSLQIMAKMAAVIGRTNDIIKYKATADRVYKSYNDVFWDRHSRSYVDGVGTTDSSAHANFFPLAFGLVPDDRQADVVRYLHSRIATNNGMPASVYGAQYLLEALFQSGDADTALNLMTTNGPRGWVNMINMGSTLTTEAWNFNDKTNMDWNHAWGAAPANIISHFVLGVRPITPGYGQILIQPQLGDILSYVEGTIPTIRGPISIQLTNTSELFRLAVNIPGNVIATVRLPISDKTRAAVIMDGKIIAGAFSNGWLTVTGIGSGNHIISLRTNNVPPQLAGQLSNSLAPNKRTRSSPLL